MNYTKPNNLDTYISALQVKDSPQETSYATEEIIFLNHITGDFFPPNKSIINCLVAIYCQKGGISFYWDNQILTARKGDLVVLYLNQVFACKKTFCDFEGMALLVSSQIIPQLPYQYLHFFELRRILCSKAIISLDQEDSSFLIDHFRLGIRFFKKKERYSTKTLTLLITIMFNEFILKSKPTFYAKPNSLDKRHEQTANAFKEIIDTKYHKNINIKWCCQQLKEKESYASACFYKYYKLHPSTYLAQKRLYRAMILLIESDKSIKEISQKMGYNSPSTFCRIFKKKINFTPAVFKNLEVGLQQSIIQHTIHAQIVQ